MSIIFCSLISLLILNSLEINIFFKLLSKLIIFESSELLDIDVGVTTILCFVSDGVSDVVLGIVSDGVSDCVSDCVSDVLFGVVLGSVFTTIFGVIFFDKILLTKSFSIDLLSLLFNKVPFDNINFKLLLTIIFLLFFK